ncbi:MAG: hypothetical protein COY80_02840, partial [Candidatus Pacebacteria bacterium CG_4_10_14_0_8_um_filter_42_14]
PTFWHRNKGKNQRKTLLNPKNVNIFYRNDQEEWETTPRSDIIRFINITRTDYILILTQGFAQNTVTIEPDMKLSTYDSSLILWKFSPIDRDYHEYCKIDNF